MEKILKLVCDYYEIPLEGIVEKTRQRHIVRARQMFYLLMFENMHQISVTKSAKFLNQDHATALYGINKMNEEISLYSDARNDYNYLSHRIDSRFIPKPKYYGNNNQVYCNWCVYVRS